MKRLGPSLCLLPLAACGSILDGAADVCVFGLNDADEKIAQCDANLLRPDDVEALAGVVEITGHLGIRGPAVDDLAPLVSLRRVGGGLIVSSERLSGRGPSLRDLTGLDALEVVGGGLTLLSTDLEHVDALGALRRVGGALKIRENDRLTDLDGLAGVERVVGDVWITANPALTSLQGLGGLDAIGPDGMVPCDGGPGGELDISGNAALASLDGLEGITAARAVHVDGAALTSVDGLANLAIAESLGVYAEGAPAGAVDALRARVEICGE